MSTQSIIRLMVFDVDGVMTDGKLYYGPEGECLKVFHVRDGLGLKWLMQANIQCAVITGRQGPAIEKRMQDLRIQHLITGREDKGQALIELTEKLQIPLTQTGYMGDDWPDLSAFELAAWTACPQDAASCIIEKAHYISPLQGGHGAVRDVCEKLLIQTHKAN
jgi:3-deoxy-D-manno-octulosonate 8-phosphate phosphatase (KDO 8-P phosphatase)